MDTLEACMEGVLEACTGSALKVCTGSALQEGSTAGSRDCSLVVETLWGVADEVRARRTRNRKWMGEVAESAFFLKAAQLGLMVAKPWGDSSRYDVIVDTGEQLVRVQVKSTGCRCEDRYAIAAHGSNPRVAYTKEEIDILVAFIVPEDAWYIVPVEAFTPRTHLWFYPRGEHAGQYEQYREAWHLLGVGQLETVK